MKNKKLFSLAFSAVALLALASCGGSNNPLDGLEEMDEDTVEAFEDELKIANNEKTYYGQNDEEGEEIEGIFGNIYLPSEVNGAEIIWKSSNENIISTKWNGDQAPGVVNRPKQDKEVTLTAYVKKDGAGAAISQTVTVKGLDYVPEDEDYEAYLFGHFVGEGHGTTVNGEKVATGEQMFFALADVGQG